MKSDITFQLDTKGGEEILTAMAMPTVERAAAAIANRATAIAATLSSNPPEITVASRFGTIKRGVRSVATITASGRDDHQNYIGAVAIRKAKDAGRLG